MQRIRALTQSPAMRQSLALVVATTVAYGLDYLFNLASGRLLDRAEFGVLVAVTAVGQILVVGSRIIQTVVTRYVAQFRAQAESDSRIASFFRRMFRSAWLWGTAVLLFMSLLSLPLSWLLDIDDLSVLLALAVATMLMVIRPVVGGTLQGIQAFAQLGGVQLIQAVLRLTVGVLFIWWGWGAFGAMAALPIASVCALFYGWYALRETVDVPRDIHHGVEGREMFRYSAVTAVGLIAYALLVNMDAILVRRFFDPLLAGDYGAAVTLGKVIQFFPLAIIMILFPKAAQRRAERRDPAGVLLPALAVVSLICGGIALVYASFPELIVGLTVGAEYEVDGRLLGLLGTAMLFLSLANVWLNYFLSTERPFFIALIPIAILLQGGLMMMFHDELWHWPAIMTFNGAWLTVAGTIIFWRTRHDEQVVSP